mgnify:CR=1 FL=1
MNDKNERICEECGGMIRLGIINKDRRGYNYCEKCGLCIEPNNPMVKNKSDLINFAINNGLQNKSDEIRNICNINNLRECRLIIAKMINEM